MGTLESLVEAFFAEDGALAYGQAGYRPRTGQLAMAHAVAQAINANDCLVVEAGTGVGKTYAYLAPALLSGRRVMVSTATKALQDQLHARDLPAVIRALGLPARVALLKGRSSYLCPHRLEQAWDRVPAGDRYLSHQLRGLEAWAGSTRTGDLAEVPGLDERSEVIPLVTSTRDNCLGADCPRFRGCHVNAARRDAMGADVVVVNHHLFFADWAVRESGMAELLPSVDVVVFDEAHQLLETGVQFLGDAVGSHQLLDWGRDVLVAGLSMARGQRDWQALVSALEQHAQAFRLILQPRGHRAGASQRLRWLADVPDGLDPLAWSDGCSGVRCAIEALHQALDGLAEQAPELMRLHDRGGMLLERFDRIAQPPASAFARWIELGAHWRMVLSPLDVSRPFFEHVRGTPEAQAKAWVFTSATLGADASLGWFTRPLGLDGVARTLQVDSPFDYDRQASLFIPPALPRPAEPGHTEALARRIWPWILRLGGRTLVLTTTLRALAAMARELERFSRDELGPDIIVQGSGPKRDLLERFRRAGQGEGAAGAVLVASASFWEGVDLPGECLQMVVIDKLPFPPPDDPWVEARSRALQAEGGNPFRDHALPEAAVALKQGAGRLIRSETDRGILVLGDTRLIGMSYGRTLLSGLPPMRRLQDETAMWEALDELVTTASTMDLPWT